MYGNNVTSCLVSLRELRVFVMSVDNPSKEIISEVFHKYLNKFKEMDFFVDDYITNIGTRFLHLMDLINHHELHCVVQRCKPLEEVTYSTTNTAHTAP